MALASAGALHAASPEHSTAVDFRAWMNRGFLDAQPGDGQGGWTDEGPGQDLAAFSPEKISPDAPAFSIVDPAHNGGKSCLALAGPGQELLPRKIGIPVSDASGWKYLYLLHAAASTGAENTGESTLIGRLTIVYADGGTQQEDVVLGRDVGDWQTPDPLPNARLAWKNDAASAGLFASRFPLSGKAVSQIQLECSGSALWLLLGITASPEDWTAARQQADLIQAGDDWIPCPLKLDIEPGGVFDQSALNDAPAGKYGPLITTPQGHFEFRDRPGFRAKFWGVNTCFDVNFPEHDEAERLAARLARSGYNTVRLHHYDGLLLKKGSSSDLDPDRLDRLDFFFAALKKQGIYINIDLFSSNRNFTQQEIPDLGIDPGPSRLIKRLLPASENAFQAWTRFARNLLTHRNPYTGLTWAGDPALIGICPLNEDTLYEIFRDGPTSPMARFYEEVFTRREASGGHRPDETGDARRIRLLTEISGDSYRRIRDFLRSLGVQAPLTGSNFRSSQALAFVRSEYDYVDNHDYWNHPTFPEKRWAMPVKFNQKSSLKTFCWLPRNLMPTRIFGKPFVVTEFNFVWPNAFRAEGGALMASYSLLQDWDALYNFAYAEKKDHAFSPQPSRFFSLASDPVGLLADRFSALVFRRQEIPPAREGFVFAVEEKTAFSGAPARPRAFPNAFSELGFVARIGSLPGSPQSVAADPALKTLSLQAVVAEGCERKDNLFPATPDLAAQLTDAGLLSRDAVNRKTGRFVASGGAVELDTARGTFLMRTPSSEGFVLPAGRSLQGERVRVENGRVFATVYVTSVDGLPLADSTRLLVLHLTDSLNTGSRFRDATHTLLESWGTLPHLVRKGEAQVTLRLGAGDWKAWAVDLSGKRLGEVPLAKKDDTLILQAHTALNGEGVLAYEIAR